MINIDDSMELKVKVESILPHWTSANNERSIYFHHSKFRQLIGEHNPKDAIIIF